MFSNLDAVMRGAGKLVFELGAVTQRASIFVFKSRRRYAGEG